MNIRDYAAELHEWLQHDNTVEPIVGKLAELDPPQWRQFIDSSPALRGERVSRKLIDRAHWLLSYAPKDAVTVAHLAVKFAKAVVGLGDDEKDAAVELQADAMREYTAALNRIEDFNNARAAADEATFLYSLLVSNEHPIPPDDDGTLLWLILALIPASQHSTAAKDLLRKVAIHGLILGQIIAGQGELDEGLRLLEQATNVLLSCCSDPKTYVQGRIIHSKLLGERGYHQKMADVLFGTIAVAKDLHDQETQAHLLNHLGYVLAFHLKRPEQARAYCREALRLFEELDKRLEAIRPRNMLATLFLEQGTATAINKAISQFFISRAAYLDLGLPNDAAKLMLRIIRGFVLARRQAHINWPDVRDTFRDILRPDSWRALDHLAQIAAAGGVLTVADVEDAEDMLRLSLEGPAEIQEAG